MKKFDLNFVAELEKEGLTQEQAVLVASTELEGVETNQNGTVNGYQTFCHMLTYDENLRDSKGKQEGRAKCTREVEEWLLANGFNSVDDYINSRLEI